MRSAYAYGLQGVGGFPNSSGICKPENHASNIDFIFNIVTGGSGDIGYDGFLLLE